MDAHGNAVKKSKESNMSFAVIPVIVWFLLSICGGAIIGGGTVGAVVLWKDREKAKEIEIVDIKGSKCVIPGDSMSCVDLYYKSIMSTNYYQYQVCVMEPLDIGAFTNKVCKRLDIMKCKGLEPLEQPVRGRSKIKEKEEVKVAIVFSISPWSGKEEKYNVVTQGQGWKIVEEE